MGLYYQDLCHILYSYGNDAGLSQGEYNGEVAVLLR